MSPDHANPQRHSTRPGPATGAWAYWQLIRPRIVAMVLLTITVSALVSADAVPGWLTLAHALLGSTLVIVGAIALNQRIEHDSDCKMPRTWRRPLPAGTLSDREVTIFALATSLAGAVYLAVLVNREIVLLAAASWLIYVWVYTPLKMFTAWQTPIGAVPGAMPVLLGSAAAGAAASPTALALFGIVYFWQFPHSMAIAWLYRRQFAQAGLKVATVVDASGRTAAVLAVAGAAVLLPLSLVPWAVAPGCGGCAAVVAGLGVWYLAASIRFFRRRDDRAARRLLHVSLIYLPTVFLTLLVASWL